MATYTYINTSSSSVIIASLLERCGFTASPSDLYKVGDAVTVKIAGKSFLGVITKPPHSDTGNYGVRFKIPTKPSGFKIVNTVASPAELSKP